MRTFILMLPLLAACNQPPEAPRAEVSEPTAPAAAEQQPAAGRVVPIAPDASRVSAVGAKVTGSHTVVFPIQRASARVTDAGTLEAVEIILDMAELESEPDRLVQHLKSEDFFDVQNHPEATFRSTRVAEGSDEEGATHTITGDLTIRGTTKSLTFPATIENQGGTLRGTATFAIDRHDFEVSFPGMPDDLIRAEVPLTIALVVPMAGDTQGGGQRQ